MNLDDLTIRRNFHRRELQKHHNNKNTLVIDELGLNHGKNRADIATVNGKMIGYEIKSDNDTLYRLEEQIKSYNAIFDKINIIVGLKHINKIPKYIPNWWGIFTANYISKSDIRFNLIRKPTPNKNILPILIAKLLWKDEVIELLKERNVSNKQLRQPREFLYEALVDISSTNELRKIVRIALKKRNNWRCRESLSQCDDLSPSSSI